MKITCQTCQSKYTVSDEKVQGKTVKIKCRKCGATILVNSSGATQSGGAVDPVSVSTTAGEAGLTFQVNVAEGDQRSMSLPELVAAYNASVVTADTYVWADGMGDWQPLGQVESVVAALNAGTAAPAPQAAAYAPEPVAAAAPAAEHRAAARRDPGRRADVFAGGMGGHAAEEVASSAQAFNGRPPPAAPTATGQREENSMLFSLSALTAKPAAAAPSKSTASREDSGLIDLKALAASAGAGPTSAVPDHGGALGLFPLGAPIAAPMAAPPVAVASIAPPPSNKTPLFIGIGIAVASLAIVGAFFAMKGGGDKPPPPLAENTAQTAAPPAPTVTATAEPTASAVASTTPTAEPTSTAVAKGGKGGKAPAKGGTAGAAAGPVKGGAAATPVPAAAPAGPKKGNCGCAANDLLCAMKCSAK